MAKNEFVLTPATGRNFIGRKELMEELCGELGKADSHVGFCLYGRRRVGKTSALAELKSMLDKKKGVVVAYLSLYDVADLSMKTFAEELIGAVVDAYREKGLFPLQTRMRKIMEAPMDVVLELLKSAKIEATVLEHIKVMFEFGGKSKNYSEYLRHAFNTGEVLAKSTSTKCVIVLDEFPEILNVENGLQLVKMMRTQYEVQKKTALVLSGSIKKTLAAAALSEASPFYKQLVPKHLMPFTEEETGEFLRSYLGKSCRGDVRQLHQLTGGLPFYLQFIGRSTGYAGTVEEAVRRFITQEGDLFFKEEFDKLNDRERRIAATLSSGSKSLSGIARELGEPATTIGRYVAIMAGKDTVIRKGRGHYQLSDNMFAYWLRHRYATD